MWKLLLFIEVFWHLVIFQSRIEIKFESILQKNEAARGYNIAIEGRREEEDGGEENEGSHFYIVLLLVPHFVLWITTVCE